ncbi:hypothetical protein GCM10017557_29310 [Streptomyces aurantiacus]|uniref:Secreted protein n=1 Tax=Streptomyces aurantiacus TaxID=47760 RepID=A0A7G1NZG8_9ACTN|nr:hypothetical protein GCM10017557_29310 [Streptomyces aurantiacus]
MLPAWIATVSKCWLMCLSLMGTEGNALAGIVTAVGGGWTADGRQTGRGTVADGSRAGFSTGVAALVGQLSDPSGSLVPWRFSGS